jgi:hypothetical protein
MSRIVRRRSPWPVTRLNTTFVILYYINNYISVTSLFDFYNDSINIVIIVEDERRREHIQTIIRHVSPESFENHMGSS